MERENTQATSEPEDVQQVVDDTGQPDAAPAREPAEDGGGQPRDRHEARRQEKPARSAQDEARQELYSKFEAKRQEEDAEFSGDPHDPDLIYGRDDGGDPAVDALEREAGERAREAERQELAAAAGRPAPTGRTERVKVDGHEYEVDVADLVANYQQNSAADRRLAEAKAIIEQARQLQAATTAQPGQPAGAPAYQSDEQGRSDAGMPQDDQDALYQRAVEAMQLGDTQEAEQALRELMTTVATPQISQEEVVRNAVFRMRLDDEDRRSTTTLQKFLADNPEIKDNPHLQAVGLNFMDHEMVADFRRAGVTEQEIAERLRTPDAIRSTHKAARAAGWAGIRSLEELLPPVVERTRAWIDQTAGVTRSAAPPQPQGTRQARVQRVASQPAQRAGPVARPKQPETVQSIISNMRTARGFAS